MAGSEELLPARRSAQRDAGDADLDELGGALEVLANPVRLQLLHRLASPAFVPDLAKEFDMTRQAIKKHLDALDALDLVNAQPARRGPLPATQYSANPPGLFALKESVQGLAVRVDPAVLPPSTTRLTDGTGGPGPGGGGGLLLVHGDRPGRWFPLQQKPGWIVGRDARVDVPLPYDPFASARHALLRRTSEGWMLTDLDSTNGTRVNFRPVEPGEVVDIAPGDLLTVGKSHLLLRDGV